MHVISLKFCVTKQCKPFAMTNKLKFDCTTPGFTVAPERHPTCCQMQKLQSHCISDVKQLQFPLISEQSPVHGVLLLFFHR